MNAYCMYLFTVVELLLNITCLPEVRSTFANRKAHGRGAALKGQCYEMDIFFEGINISSVLSVYAIMVIKICLLPYTINNFLFNSLKLLTNFENAY